VAKLGSTGGAVESDETFVGPNPRKMHKDRRVKLAAIRSQHRLGDMYLGKTAVHGMLDRDAREIRCKVIPNVRRETLQNEILDNIEHGSRLYTDEWAGYMGMEKTFVHEVVQHAKEYVRGQVHTNGLENFWSLFKRNLRGTYVSVEPFHLDRYLDEQVFRFNNRGGKKREERVTDSDRFMKAMSLAPGKRLTYTVLTGKGVDSLHHSAAAQGQEEPF
jgi:transposase-like protein